MKSGDIKSVDFKEDVVAILEEFFAYFECLPVKIDGKVDIVSWYCGACSHHNQQSADGAERDCMGKIWGTEECIAKFYPIILRHNWLAKLVPSPIKQQRWV
jgi:hypothetical protein